MNDKKRILILLKILDKIQEDNKNARKVEESITTICKEEVFLLNKYSLFCFLILQLLEQRIYLRSTDNYLNSLFAVIVMICNSSLAVWRDRCSRFKTRENVQIFLQILSCVKGQIKCYSQLKIVVKLLQRLSNLQKGFNKTFFKLQLHGVARKTNKKKTAKMIRKELLASILEVSNREEDYLQMNEVVKNAKELKDGIRLINKYENLLKGAKNRANS